MATTSDLAQFLLEQKPQNSLARLSFYHYIKHFEELESSLSTGIVSRFLRRALLIPQWQQNRKELSECLFHDLALFQKRAGMVWESEELTEDLSRQIVSIEHVADLRKILEAQASGDSSSRSRVIPVNEGRVLRLIEFANEKWQVEVFGSTCLVVKGRLEPVAPLSQLFYSRQLEIDPNRRQVIELSDGLTAVFALARGHIKGVSLRAPTFSKFEPFAGPSTSVPQVFYAIKRLESAFINPQTDPFYRELVAMLERAHSLMQEGRVEGLALAQEALKKGRLAIRNVFPHDKFLWVLVTNLQYQTDQGQNQWPEPRPNPTTPKTPYA